MQPDLAVLDPAMIAELQDLADMDEAFVREVLTEYVEQATNILAAMRASLSADAMGSFRLGAHALGGSSLQVGAARVASICHTIQSNENDAAGPAEAALERLAFEVRRVDVSVALEEWGQMTH